MKTFQDFSPYNGLKAPKDSFNQGRLANRGRSLDEPDHSL